MNSISTREDFNSKIESEKLTVILFTTKWCGDCMFIKPFMPAVESAYPMIDFYEVDRDQMMDLAQELEIMGIPSFVAYKNGKEVSRFVSSLRKTKAEIEEYLNKTVPAG